MQVERVDFVSFLTQDIQRARSFYGVRQMAFCKDPDGNALMLHRRYAPRG
jgi:hypothetical protein